jgi:hypothetical protein
VIVGGKQLVLTAYPRPNDDFLYITKQMIRKAFAYQNQSVYCVPDNPVLDVEIKNSTSILVMEEWAEDRFCLPIYDILQVLGGNYWQEEDGDRMWLEIHYPVGLEQA